jgi:hypothetical protein
MDETTKKPVWIAGFLAEIQSERLQNKSHKCYYEASLLSMRYTAPLSVPAVEMHFSSVSEEHEYILILK